MPLPDNYDPPASQLITMLEAAAYAGRTDDNMRQAARRGVLWHTRKGTVLLTTRAAVAIYLTEHGNPEHSQVLREKRQQEEERSLGEPIDLRSLGPLHLV